jgi:TPP-dependent pyruvate/acetoin dehydrogenase alpha subunit
VSGIPVVADDAVAIYRVAQESIGRARVGGGAALMECVPFVTKGAAGPGDGIAGLESYLLERKVATKAWMEREAKGFAKRVAREKASK